MSSPAAEISNGETRKISEVVEDTGVSKELIHHYIREGLLPRPEKRAQYSEEQVRLLVLIRNLRDDYHLPLEVIRRLFELYEFAPERLEPLLFSESLSNRLSALAETEGLPEVGLIPRARLLELSGISPERLDEYLRTKLITPLSTDGEALFSTYDLNVIRLCEQGVTLGIPFETFRSVGSFSRIAFELEYEDFLRFGMEETRQSSMTAFLREVFLRNEIALGFVQNILQGQMRLHLNDLTRRPTASFASFDDIIYCPSHLFLERHRLEPLLQTDRDRLVREPASVRAWSTLGRHLIHAGQYGEAAFFLEEARQKWPEDKRIRLLCGQTRLCAGEFASGLQHLEPLIEEPEPEPLAQAYYALGLYVRVETNGEKKPRWENEHRIVALARAALERVQDRKDWEALDVQLVSGWLLSATSAALVEPTVGFRTLAELSGRLEEFPTLATELPGLRERYEINASYLILECLGRSISFLEDTPEDMRADAASVMKRRILELDPASRFATTVFLKGEKNP